jgi:hypothetical protein
MPDRETCRIRRTSCGLIEQDPSELLDIDYYSLAAREAAVESIKLLFEITKLLDVCQSSYFVGTPKKTGRGSKELGLNGRCENCNCAAQTLSTEFLQSRREIYKAPIPKWSHRQKTAQLIERRNEAQPSVALRFQARAYSSYAFHLARMPTYLLCRRLILPLTAALTVRKGCASLQREFQSSQPSLGRRRSLKWRHSAATPA